MMKFKINPKLNLKRIQLLLQFLKTINSFKFH